jgi:hypothetical protein
VKIVLVIHKEIESYSATGFAFRAYRECGTPFYMGAETREGLIQRILEDNPEAQIKDAELEPGAFYWVRGQGVCRYSHNTGKVSHVVNPYQYNSDEWGGDLYVDPKDIASRLGRTEMYRNNVRERLTPTGKKP